MSRIEISKLSFEKPTWLEDVPFHPALVSRMADIRHHLLSAKGEHMAAMTNVQNHKFAEGLWAQRVEVDDVTCLTPYMTACPYCNRYSFHDKRYRHPVDLSKSHSLQCDKCGWTFTVPEKPSKELAEFVKKDWDERWKGTD